MREEMLRTLDRIVEDNVTTAMREAADDKGSGGGGGTADATQGLWTALEEAGITTIGAGDEDDVAFGDAMQLVRRAGFHALPVPLAETIIARRLLTAAGIAPPVGAITLASPQASDGVTETAGGVTGQARGVPYGRSADAAVVASNGRLLLLDVRNAVVARSSNMAGEPRDTIDLAKAKLLGSVPLADARATLEAEGALIRAVGMAGALEAALDHALTWANDRIQFGKPIAKHQAVQHLLAQLAEETAAGGAAADFATEASTEGPDRFAIAVAKSRAGEAAGKAANIAHAAFGAMGFTREHALHYTTRRLWSWRNEFGAEVYWQAELGRMAAAEGGGGLWPLLTANG